MSTTDYRVYAMTPEGLQRALKESGFRQKDLADLWGRTEGTVSQKLSGRIPITREEIEQLCELIDAKPAVVKEIARDE